MLAFSVVHGVSGYLNSLIDIEIQHKKKYLHIIIIINNTEIW